MTQEISSDTVSKKHQQLLNKALMAAVRADKVADAQRLLVAGAQPNYRSGRNSYTALEWLIKSKNLVDAQSIEMIKVLAKHGADPNIVPKIGSYPSSSLRSACIFGQKEYLLAMLDPNGLVKVDLLFRDENGFTPSMTIACKFSTHVMAAAQKYFEENVLSKRDSIESTRGDLWLSVDKTGKNSFMSTSHSDNMKWIIDQNFMAPEKLIEVSDNTGKTALWIATEYGNSPKVEFLLGRGAEIDVVDSTGQTLIEMAKKAASLTGFGGSAQHKILSHLQTVKASRKAMEVVEAVTRQHSGIKP